MWKYLLVFLVLVSAGTLSAKTKWNEKDGIIRFKVLGKNKVVYKVAVIKQQDDYTKWLQGFEVLQIAEKKKFKRPSIEVSELIDQAVTYSEISSMGIKSFIFMHMPVIMQNEESYMCTKSYTIEGQVEQEPHFTDFNLYGRKLGQVGFVFIE